MPTAKTISTPKKLHPAEIVKILASPTRFNIISLLIAAERKDEDVCVKEIAAAVGKSPSATSHQLARLEDKRVVKARREGQTICYRLEANATVDYLRVITEQFN